MVVSAYTPTPFPDKAHVKSKRIMPAPLTDDEEPYASSEDSDFAPETGAAADESEQSASEDEGPEDSSKRQKQQQHAANTNASKRSSATTSGNGIAAVADVGYDNSGDEAIIKKGVKKRKKGKGNDRLEDDEGGEGGLIKTRRQRAAEYVDIIIAKGDAFWALL